MITPYFKSTDKNFYLLHGDSFELLEKFDHKFDMVFADPPYFLSNGGLSIQSGKIVSVNKGNWDESHGYDFVNDFNRKWLSLVRDKMKEDATIWISGTMHNIFSIGQILTELGFKILNVITWEKTNPPPNFSCRYFTYSTEQIIWARKSEKIPHYYNYELMKKLNGGKQMKDVWTLPAIAPWEKSCGKHPTQKPLSVLTRLILASTKPRAWILDPFTGSSTTGISANLCNRRFLGIDKEIDFLEISKNRKSEIEVEATRLNYIKKISKLNSSLDFAKHIEGEVDDKKIKVVLGFCKSSSLKSKLEQDTFRFDAIDNKLAIKDFPIGIEDGSLLVLYSGGRSKPYRLTGLNGKIQSIKLMKHEESISSSKRHLYYEIKLDQNFTLEPAFCFEMNAQNLYDEGDSYNMNLFRQYLPSLTTLDRILKSKKD